MTLKTCSIIIKIDLKIQTSEKWNYCNYIPLQNMLNEDNNLTHWHIPNKIVVEVFKKEQIAQLQLEYMSNPLLNNKNVFNDQM